MARAYTGPTSANVVRAPLSTAKRHESDHGKGKDIVRSSAGAKCGGRTEAGDEEESEEDDDDEIVEGSREEAEDDGHGDDTAADHVPTLEDIQQALSQRGILQPLEMYHTWWHAQYVENVKGILRWREDPSSTPLPPDLKDNLMTLLKHPKIADTREIGAARRLGQSKLWRLELLDVFALFGSKMFNSRKFTEAARKLEEVFTDRQAALAALSEARLRRIRPIQRPGAYGVARTENWQPADAKSAFEVGQRQRAITTAEVQQREKVTRQEQRPNAGTGLGIDATGICNLGAKQVHQPSAITGEQSSASAPEKHALVKAPSDGRGPQREGDGDASPGEEEPMRNNVQSDEPNERPVEQGRKQQTSLPDVSEHDGLDSEHGDQDALGGCLDHFSGSQSPDSSPDFDFHNDDSPWSPPLPAATSPRPHSSGDSGIGGLGVSPGATPQSVAGSFRLSFNSINMSLCSPPPPSAKPIVACHHPRDEPHPHRSRISLDSIDSKIVSTKMSKRAHEDPEAAAAQKRKRRRVLVKQYVRAINSASDSASDIDFTTLTNGALLSRLHPWEAFFSANCDKLTVLAAPLAADLAIPATSRLCVHHASADTIFPRAVSHVRRTVEGTCRITICYITVDAASSNSITELTKIVRPELEDVARRNLTSANPADEIQEHGDGDDEGQEEVDCSEIIISCADTAEAWAALLGATAAHLTDTELPSPASYFPALWRLAWHFVESSDHDIPSLDIPRAGDIVQRTQAVGPSAQNQARLWGSTLDVATFAQSKKSMERVTAALEDLVFVAQDLREQASSIAWMTLRVQDRPAPQNEQHATLLEDIQELRNELENVRVRQNGAAQRRVRSLEREIEEKEQALAKTTSQESDNSAQLVALQGQMEALCGRLSTRIFEYNRHLADRRRAMEAQ